MQHRRESKDHRIEILNAVDCYSDSIVDHAEWNKIEFYPKKKEEEDEYFTSSLIFSISVNRWRFLIIRASKFLQFIPM